MSNQEDISKYRELALKNHVAKLQELANILGVDMAGLPKVFQLPAKRALKVGVYEDLLAAFPGADEEELKLWIMGWTRTKSYLTRITRGTNRHDLDGNDYGTITESERSYAQGVLNRRAKRKQSA